MKTTNALCVRTAMIGGGTSYDVYFRCADKPSHPLHGSTYATQILRGQGGPYFEVIDAIDPKPRWSMESGIEKWETHKRLEKRAKRLAFRIAKRAFPELTKLAQLPTFWASWSLPSTEVKVPVRLTLPE